MRRSLSVLTLSVLISALTPAAVTAESTLWTLVASPLTATVGAQKVFALTGTNADPLADVLSSNEIGCVILDVPSNFTVASATVTGASDGNSWQVESIVSNRVTVHANSGGDRLESFDTVSFTVTATPTSAGSLAWGSRAFRDQNCGGSGALVDIPPVVVVTGTSQTPSPRPTATPTPRPTSTPTPLPLPSLPPSLPLPSIPGLLSTPHPTPTASDSRVDASSQPTPSPSAARPDASSSAGAIPPGTEGTPPTSGAGASQDPGDVTRPAVFRLPSVAGIDLGLGLGDLNLLGGIGTWVVPAATIGGAGLLVLLFIGLQAGGTLIWVPAVRRLRGDRTSRRRRRRRAIG
jgi:hypothetical protein